MATLRTAETARRIQQHWDTRAATFDNDPEHGLHGPDQRRAWRDVLARLAGDAPRRILDVGCGTGFLALLLAELGHTATAVDFAPQMLAVARQKARRAGLPVQFRLEDAAWLTDADGTYDLVVARHVIWTQPDPARAVAEWSRVLRSGGRLAVIEGQWSPHDVRAERAVAGRRSALVLLRAASGMIWRTARRAASKRTPAALLRGASEALRRGAVRGKWMSLRQRWDDWRYQQVHAALPFFGGAPAERLVTLFTAHGLVGISVEPLMDPVLWGEAPRYARYLITGCRG